MKEYTYDGPVLKFGECIRQKWRASTYASSAARAKSNLTYRYKKENGLLPEAKVDLPGKIMEA